MTTRTPGERIDDPKLMHAVITARAWEGFTIQTKDGQPATLAVVDRNGRIVESGTKLVDELWDVAMLSYRLYLIGEKALRVLSTPAGRFQERYKG